MATEADCSQTKKSLKNTFEHVIQHFRFLEINKTFQYYRKVPKTSLGVCCSELESRDSKLTTPLILKSENEKIPTENSEKKNSQLYISMILYHPHQTVS